ncbi:MAG: DUF6802 family protein [Mycobacteriaceae bacterium]
MHDFDAVGGHDEPGVPQPEVGTLTVHVDGNDGVYEPTADLDGDGHAESVVVEGGEPGTTEGGYAYSDTSGDGTADTLTEYDARGEVVAQAVYDESSGDWREVSPGSIDVTGAAAGGGPGSTDGARDLTIDTSQGPEGAGPATVDTDGDGVADTVVTTTSDGATLLVTDVDGDSSADVLTEVGSDGAYATYTHTGDGEWTETDHGNLADGVKEGGGRAPVTTDPATGQWRSA